MIDFRNVNRIIARQISSIKPRKDQMIEDRARHHATRMQADPSAFAERINNHYTTQIWEGAVRFHYNLFVMEKN